ncbi:hypothetical protein ACFQU2_23595 [Siccirubricoccus deserti]
MSRVQVIRHRTRPAPWSGCRRCPAPPARATSPAMLLEDNGTTTDTIIVFSQAFRPGDLPRGRGLAARTMGTPLRAQLNVKTRHPDGSAGST